MEKISRQHLKKFQYISFVLASCCFANIQSTCALPGATVPGTGNKIVSKKTDTDKKTPKSEDTAHKDQDTAILNATSVTLDQLVNKPQEYFNKDVKFKAKFASFSSLALDYKPAMRSSRNYLSFLVFRPDTHIPFSEIKLAMVIPKEKDPETHMLQTLKEGNEIEIYGHVFACALDEPWLDVLKIKNLSGSSEKDKVAEDKETGEDEDSPTENKHLVK